MAPDKAAIPAVCAVGALLAPPLAAETTLPMTEEVERLAGALDGL